MGGGERFPIVDTVLGGQEALRSNSRWDCKYRNIKEYAVKSSLVCKDGTKTRSVEG